MTSEQQQEAKQTPVLVNSFYERGQQALDMKIVAGEGGLGKMIAEPTVNRPGLALSGYLDHFANRRIQVIGMAENSYLASLSDEERHRRLDAFFSSRIPCVVITRGKAVFPQIVKHAEEFRVPVFRSQMITKHFVNAATIILENMSAPRMTAHGTMVDIRGIGVMIQGKPGMGKSEAALGLIERGHSLVADDVTELRLDASGTVIGSSAETIRFHMEIRGLGIIHVPSLFGVQSVRLQKRLDLVATLCEPGTFEENDRSGMTDRTVNLLGVDIPRVYVPVAHGRTLATLIETAALDETMRRLGHDAVKELDASIIDHMNMTAKGAGE